MDKTLSKPLTIPYTGTKCEGDLLDYVIWPIAGISALQIRFEDLQDADELQNQLILVAANA